MSISCYLRYILLTLSLVSVLALGVTSCSVPEESETLTDTTTSTDTTTDDGGTTTDDGGTTTDDGGTTTDDGGTTTTTSTTSTTDTTTGVIYQAITVKKKPKDPSIKYSSLTAKPTATNLNFDNAQFGNVKFQ